MYLFSVHMCIFFSQCAQYTVIPGYKDITVHIVFLVLLVIKSAFRYMVLSGICMDR